eukprot:2068422-Amphidinium_carterae.1
MQTAQKVQFSWFLGGIIWSDGFLFGTVRIWIKSSTLTAKSVLDIPGHKFGDSAVWIFSCWVQGGRASAISSTQQPELIIVLEGS